MLTKSRIVYKFFPNYDASYDGSHSFKVWLDFFLFPP